MHLAADVVSTMEAIRIDRMEALLFQENLSSQDKIMFCDKLKVTPLELEKVLKMAIYIFDESKSQGLSSMQLIEILSSQMSIEYAGMLGRVNHKLHEAKTVQDVDSESPRFGKSLQGVEWDVNMNLANSNCFQNKDRAARIHFELDEKETFTIEFDHDALFSLFKNIESIQESLFS